MTFVFCRMSVPNSTRREAGRGVSLLFILVVRTGNRGLTAAIGKGGLLALLLFIACSPVVQTDHNQSAESTSPLEESS